MEQEKTKAVTLVLLAFDTLFNKRDYELAKTFWSPQYIQHSAHIAPGRDGLFELIKSLPATLKYENSLAMAHGDLVVLHGRYSGTGLAANWVVCDIARVKDGLLVEHWDVIQDEATRAQSKSGNPMFGNSFPAVAELLPQLQAETAPTRFVAVGDSSRVAYRRWGRADATTGAGSRHPLLFLNYFAANMDDWDPAITNGFAAEREVILLDSPGIGSSTGTTPSTVDAMTRDVVAFCRALNLTRFDVIGFSLGGMIAQQLAVEQPTMIRRLILLGTGPRGGEGMTFTELRADELDNQAGLVMSAFFTGSEASKAAGQAYLQRLKLRVLDRDAPVSKQAAIAQLTAIREWGAAQPSDRQRILSKTKIHQPTLVVHGSKDVVVQPVNAFLLAQHLPDAQLIIYPDASHGAQSQHAQFFLQHAKLFLNS